MEKIGERIDEFRKALIGYMVEINKLRGVSKELRKDVEKQQKSKDFQDFPEQGKIRIEKAGLMIFAERLKLGVSIQERALAKTRNFLAEVEEEIEKKKALIKN